MSELKQWRIFYTLPEEGFAEPRKGVSFRRALTSGDALNMLSVELRRAMTLVSIDEESETIYVERKR